MSKSRRSYMIPLLLIAWWSVIGLVNYFWLAQDTVPPYHDSLNHLKSSLRYYHVLQDQGLTPRGLAALLDVDKYYPPLAPLAASMFYFVFPPDMDSAIWILNQLFLALLLVGVYRLGARLVAPEGGLLAAVVVTSFPVITLQSRIFMLDIPTMAMTAWAIYGLLRTENFQRPGPSVLFGALAGLATLTKWTSLFFIFLPLTYVLIQAFKSEDRLKRGRNVLGAFAVWLLIILPWFTAHLSNLLVMSSKFGYSVAVKKGDPPIFTAPSLFFYARVLPRDIHFLWLLFFAVGTVFYFRDELKKNPILILWILGGYAILTLIRNKDIRYCMPYLPAVALIATGWIKYPRWNPWILRGGVMLLCLFTIGNSYWAFPPRHEAWHLKDAFEFIKTQKSFHPRPRVRVVPDLEEFQRHGFEYYSVLERYPLDVTTWVRFPTFTDFIVTKTGDQGFADDPVGVMQAIQRDPEGFEAVFKKKWERPLPDGSTAQIYVRDITPVSGITPDRFIQRFKASLKSYLGRYVRDPQGWVIRVEPFSNRDTLSGRFRRVTFSIDSARVASKHDRRPSLVVRDLGMELSDLTVNPYKLLRDGQFEIISLMDATPHFKIAQNDLNAYLAGLKGGFHPKVEFQDNTFRLQVPSKGWIPALDTTVEPTLVNGKNIGYIFLEFRVGGIRLPAFIPQVLTAKFNPALKPMPCRMHLRTLKIANGEILLNE